MTASPHRPPEPDLLRYGATLPLTVIDPLCRLWNEASSLVFSRPFAVDELGELQPDLVEHHEVSDDGLRHRLRPRSAASWHDGTPVSEADLALSLRLVSDPQYRGRVKQHLPGVVAVEAGQGEVQLTLERPMPVLPYILSRTCVVPAHRFSAEELAAGALDADPIGTGPYRVAERGDEACRFERHDGFHAGRAHVAGIHMTQIAEDGDRADALIEGRVDLTQIKAQHADRVGATPGLRVHALRTRVWRALTFSLSHPLLGDAAVRRALSALIDREEIVAEALGGYGRPQFYPTPPGSWANLADAPPAGRDVAFATLAEAGCHRNASGRWERDGIELSLQLAYLSTETFRKVASENIAAQFGRAGIPVRLTPITWQQYREMDATGLRGTGFDGIVVGWSEGAGPYENLASRYSTTGPYNRDGYSDPELDELLERAGQAADRQEALAAYHEVLRITHRDSIMAPLANPMYLFAGTEDLDGFEHIQVDSFYEFPQFAHRIRRATAGV